MTNYRFMLIAVLAGLLVNANLSAQTDLLDVADAVSAVPKASTINIGEWGESFTAEMYRLQGYKVVEHAGGGTTATPGLDIVVYKGELSNPSKIKIVEVKTTTNGSKPKMALLSDGTEQMSEKWIERHVTSLENSIDSDHQKLGKALKTAKNKSGQYGKIAEVVGVDMKSGRFTIYDDIPNMRSSKAESLSIAKTLENVAERGASKMSKNKAVLLLSQYDQILQYARSGGQAIQNSNSAGSATGAAGGVSSTVNAPTTPNAATPKAATPNAVTPKAATPATKGTTQAVGKVVKAIAPAAKLAGAAGIALDVGLRVASANETEQQYEKGEISNEDRTAAHVGNAAGFTVGVSGAYGGAMGGLAVGATAGAAAGSVVPIVGTAIGGAVGGVVGGIAGGIGGYIGGSYAGDEAGKAATHYFYK